MATPGSGAVTRSPSTVKLAARWRDQPIDAAEQRGLAATGRTDDGDDLVAADVEIDVAKDLKRAVMHAKLIKADARAGRCGRGRGRRAVLLAQVQQHYPPNVVAAARPIRQPIGLSHAVPASTRVAPQKG